MDTESLDLDLAVKETEECIRSEMKTEWEQLRSKDCNNCFATDAVGMHFPRKCCDNHKRQDKREPGLSKVGLRSLEMLCLCSKTCCWYDTTSNNLKFSNDGLNRRILEQSGDALLEKYRKVLDERVNKTSTNTCFRTKDHAVATYEQTKGGLLYFFPEVFVENNGTHTYPLNL